MANLPFAHLGASLKPVKRKRPAKLKRLNLLVLGGENSGKSSLTEHLLLTLNRDASAELFKAKNQSASVLPFGNLVHKTTKMTEFPISTDELRVKLIDTPGITEANGK